MESNEEDYMVIKAGRETDMVDLFENGTIYCNTSDWFRAFEDNKVRGDDNEGWRPVTLGKEANLFLKVSATKWDNPVVISPLEITITPPAHFTNIYCLVTANASQIEPGGIVYVSPRIQELGTHYVSIHDSRAFYERVANAIYERGYHFKFSKVKYFKKSPLSFNWTGFEKVDEYAWQQEARFFIYNPVKEVLIFKIGSIKDIASLRSFH